MADNMRLLRIFPNLLIQDVTGVTIRTVWPTAFDQTELVAWELAPREESGEQLHRRLQNFLAFLGPAGFGIPDDVEAVESCQSTVPAREVEWQDYSRAMAEDAAGIAPDTCDLQHRAFWRQWHAHLQQAPDAPTLPHLVPPSVRPLPWPWAGRVMTATNDRLSERLQAVLLRDEIEEFLYYEAALLDEWRLDEWLTLFTDDATYVIPATDIPDGDPRTDLMILDDDLPRLRGRVERLMSRRAPRESPWSRTRHFINNVRIRQIEGDELLGLGLVSGLPHPHGPIGPVRRPLRIPAAPCRRRLEDLPAAGRARPGDADRPRGR